MIKTLAKNIKGFVKESVLTPFFMILEVIVETIIPFLMSSMIDDGINKGDMQLIYLSKFGKLYFAATEKWVIFYNFFSIQTKCFSNSSHSPTRTNPRSL